MQKEGIALKKCLVNEKNIVYVVIFMIIAMISFGCNNAKTITTDGFINITISETTCPYCKELEAIESPYLLERGISIYRILTNDEASEYDSESDFIAENVSDLKSVPSVYWVKDGEGMNKLPIVDEKYQSYIFTEWTEDNEAYFNERLGDD